MKLSPDSGFFIGLTKSLLVPLVLIGAGAPALNAQSNYATPYAFTTLAGVAPSSGFDDGVGNAARFSSPNGIAVDSAGNVYVADRNNQTIRKIDANGVVTTLAGTAGKYGSSDGTGASANFGNPEGVAVDNLGNVYVADTGNYTIRKITPAGVVTTLAGSAGEYGSVDGTGSVARFSAAHGLTVDGFGNIYVADSGNFVIRKITPGGIVTTIAGVSGNNGFVDGAATDARFTTPSGIAVDSAGNLYVADQQNQAIRKINSSGVVTTIAGSPASGADDGAGSSAHFYEPSGITVDGGGFIYVADSQNNCIRKISPQGNVVTLAGNSGGGSGMGVTGSADGTGTAALFTYPLAVAVDGAGNLYVADTLNNKVRKITQAAVVTTLAGPLMSGNTGFLDGTTLGARFWNPCGVAVDAARNVYVADSYNHIIRMITADGVVSTFAGTAGLSGWNDGVGSAARFFNPYGLALDAAGNVYVADSGNSTIRKISPAGLVTTIAGSAGLTGSTNGASSSARFAGPTGLTVDGTGNVYVADAQNHMIRKITPAGIVSTFFDGEGGATLYFPIGVAVDAGGNVYVSDAGHNSVQKVSATGVISLVAGSGSRFLTGSADGVGSAALFSPDYNHGGPLGIALDRSGNIFTADCYNQTIRKITPSGMVTTIAGKAGFWGSQDGTGSAARFNEPYGVAVDDQGGVYVADSVNGTIRKGVIATPPAAPIITTQPANQSIAVGYAAVLNVGIDGNSTGVTYQWQKNGVDIIGANHSSYSIGEVAATDSGSYRVVVTKDGLSTTSGAAVVVITPALPALKAPADFDHDGQSDLIWQNTVTGERSFWLMNGTVFKVGVSLGMFAPDWTMVGSGDFNHDGQADLLWQNTITGERSIWLMNGTALSLGVNLGTYSTDWMIAGSGDFDGDGETDIVVQNTITGERVIWLMNGTTKVSEASLGTVAATWSIAGTGDFNGDGKMDLVWQNAATGECSVWLMNGTTKSSVVSLGVVAKEQQIVGTGDYNHDGKTDLVWTDTETGERTIWLMNGLLPISKVTFTVVSVEWSLGRPIFLTAQTAHADFNADGQTDVIWQNNATGERSISLMNGSTTGSTTSLVTTASNWVISGTGDFNHDDKPDLVWTNTTTGERTVWLMDGTTLISNVPLATISPTWVISAIGDFNYDGKPDLVWTNTATGERAIWLMNGTVFGSGISLGTIPTAWKIATTADLNGDGKTDLVWQNTSTGENSVWLMNGGAFTAGVVLDTLPVQWSIVGSGDFNGDGKADLLLQNTVTGERVVRLMNRTTFLSTISLGTFDTHWSIGN